MKRIVFLAVGCAVFSIAAKAQIHKGQSGASSELVLVPVPPNAEDSFNPFDPGSENQMIDGKEKVGISHLLNLLEAYGNRYSPEADINNDNKVNCLDLVDLLVLIEQQNPKLKD